MTNLDFVGHLDNFINHVGGNSISGVKLFSRNENS